jgi:L-amino acid N-acyltransferase YncA
MSDEYPKAVPLKDGSVVQLRPLVEDDADRVAAFYRSLSPDDLLFLREDLTQPAIVRRLANDGADVAATSILAERDGEILGQATLLRNRPAWSAHVGEVQIMVAPEARRLGLGTVLTQEIFVNAIVDGIEKVISEMTPDQYDARRVFEHLGFKEEGLLTRYVQDRSGQRHDIIILAHDVDEFLRKMEKVGVSDTFDRNRPR